MTISRRSLHQFLLLSGAGLSLGGVSSTVRAATAEDLDKDAAKALQDLYKTRPVAEGLGKKARSVLVFPKIVKAGLVFGGSYGEGVLSRSGKTAGYYNSVSASWGWQAGVESYGYAIFFMTSKAEKYLDQTKGFEIGIGPRVVVVNEGVGKSLTNATLQDDAYAFIFDQQGLMASLSIEGTKITRIKR